MNKNTAEGMNTIYFPDRHECNPDVVMIAVDIFVPSSGIISGDVLVLPGWNYSRKRWHEETSILEYAEKYSFRMIFPEMSVSSYESEYFPESRMKWAYLPGGEWIRSVLIPRLSSEFSIFIKNGNNFVVGLSTGGRGALMVPLQNPGIFSGGATLSGDCEQTLMPDEKLMIALYGEYSKFTQRWNNIDNPLKEIIGGKWEIPLYIGHGRKDMVSPFSQSELLYKELKSRYPKLTIIFNDPADAGHDFSYWGSEVPPVMDFFNKIVNGL